jgi:hypothetical protein
MGAKSCSRSWRREVFFNDDRVGRNAGAGEDQVGLIDDGPVHLLALGEVHGLSDGGGEVDVPLLAVLALDDLDLGGASHGPILVI